MKFFIFFYLFAVSSAFSQELKVKAQSFHSDQKKGISIFTGKVNIVKGNDELNASKVTIFTNKKNKPIKYVTEGNSSFAITTEEGAPYSGVAHKVIFFPNKKEYHFFQDVHLKQLDDKKEIIGEEVVLHQISGKAYAKGATAEPVIMIFNLASDEDSAKDSEKATQNDTKEDSVTQNKVPPEKQLTSDEVLEQMKEGSEVNLKESSEDEASQVPKKQTKLNKPSVEKDLNKEQESPKEETTVKEANKTPATLDELLDKASANVPAPVKKVAANVQEQAAVVLDELPEETSEETSAILEGVLDEISHKIAKEKK